MAPRLCRQCSALLDDSDPHQLCPICWQRTCPSDAECNDCHGLSTEEKQIYRTKATALLAKHHQALHNQKEDENLIPPHQPEPVRDEDSRPLETQPPVASRMLPAKSNKAHAISESEDSSEEEEPKQTPRHKKRKTSPKQGTSREGTSKRRSRSPPPRGHATSLEMHPDFESYRRNQELQRLQREQEAPRWDNQAPPLFL